jgi:hypothetical protein
MFGFNAGYSNTASRNTFLGTNAGFTNGTGSSCTFVGHVAGYSNTNAVRCTFVGDSAGFSNTVGRWNTFAGYACGIENVNGEGNSFYGKHCASNNINGNFNSYYGNHAAESMIDGNANVMMGSNAAYYQQHGDSNAYVGNMAGPSVGLANVKSNAFLGASSGYYNTVGNYNTFLGFKAGNDPTLSVNNSTAIGANTVVTASNKMILGVNNVNVGIGLSGDMVQFGPQNKLEINADPASFIYTGVGGSGLRFRQLTENSSFINNNATNTVLSVDQFGDVILVKDNGNGTGIGTCAVPATFGGADGAIDLNSTDNFYFIGNGAGPTVNNVVIGKTCPAIINGKVDVLQASGSTTGSIGIYCENQDLSASLIGQEVIGIKSFIPFQANSNAGMQIGVQGIVSGEKFNIAIDGLANGSSLNVLNAGGRFTATSTTAILNWGIVTTAADGQTNIGASAQALNGSTAIGIEAVGQNSTGTNSGVRGTGFGGTDSYGGYFTAGGASATNYAVYSDGDLFINGVGTGSSGVFYVSDSIFKTNIDSITNATNIIDQLNPKEYYFDTANSYNMRFSSSKQYGLIAQDVEVILPELVESRTKPAEYDSLNNVVFPAVTFKSVNYNAFFALLIKGMQEQQDQIENQNQRIDSLITAMDSCCSSNARIYNPNTTPTANQKDVTLSNSESIVLNQNVPNPFAEQTTITYNLPESVQKAQLLFYDAAGKLIKAVDLTTRGNGQINVFANDLSNGIYSYALVVDGQVADTKRMVKTQ